MPIFANVFIISSNRRHESPPDSPPPTHRTLDGTDDHAKRRKTGGIEGGPGVPGSANETGYGTHTADAPHETDLSLERYEYSGVSSILSGAGGVGFAVTCAFNREKSATKEVLNLLSPHLPAVLKNAPNGLRLNPVKMPGRGFLFVRLSARPDGDKNENEKKETDANDASYELGGLAATACALATAAVRQGKTQAPRWVEKIIAVQTTCVCSAPALAVAMPKVVAAALGIRLMSKKMSMTQGSDALVDALNGGLGDGVNGGRPGETGGDVNNNNNDKSATERDDKNREGGATEPPLKYAVAFTNRFKGKGDGDETNGTDSYGRNVVVPMVASAFQAALREGDLSAVLNALRNERGTEVLGVDDDDTEAVLAPKSSPESPKICVDLRDPDVTVFVEVLSVPKETDSGSRSGGFTQRLAIGLGAKKYGVFELKRGGIRPTALKRAK